MDWGADAEGVVWRMNGGGRLYAGTSRSSSFHNMEDWNGDGTCEAGGLMGESGQNYQ